jgi:DNA-binding CsgD family transcriptional regulator
MTDTITEHDLRALMAVIEEGRRDLPTEGVPWAVLDELARLVRSDWAVFSELDVVRSCFLTGQWMKDDGQRGFVRPSRRSRWIGGKQKLDDDASAMTWKYFREFLPHAYIQRTGDLAAPIRWSDFYTPAALRNAPMYAEYYHLMGDKYNIRLHLPTLPGQARSFALYRCSGPDFTERDRLVLQLLRPHVYEVYLDAQRRRRNVPRLSQREWEVLRLAHQGRSNAGIADDLFISVATVRKHMEHIFDRTGTRSRSAACALMMPHFT